MSIETNIIIVLVAVGWVALSTSAHWLRSKRLLDKWATANGFTLVKMNMNWSGFGPFLFTSQHQEVYRIKVRDHRGREHSGWAKCGGYWLGFLVDKVEVRLN